MSTMMQLSDCPTVATLPQFKCPESLARIIKLFNGVIKTEVTTKTIIAVITPVKVLLPVTKAILAAIIVPMK